MAWGVSPVASHNQFIFANSPVTTSSEDLTGADTIVLAVRCGETTSTNVTITDSLGTTFGAATVARADGEGKFTQVWVKTLVGAGTGYTVTVTSALDRFPYVVSYQAWAGGGAFTVDATASAAGVFPATLKAGAILPAGANRLGVTFVYDTGDSTVSVDSGYTVAPAAALDNVVTAYKIISASSDPEWTLSSALYATALSVAIAAAGGGGGGGSTPELVSTLKHRANTRPAPFRPGIAR